eukprot:TRINITY_DN978_c0_g1_i1.p1 TRINITY_DN978_c0_g1~~TRINITY_DN978_c0_g1_i1.p1  ORF type:complete len:619 (-),score=244.43 TRINITY_DN978_c0_g1_i1:76-1899(-)
MATTHQAAVRPGMQNTVVPPGLATRPLVLGASSSAAAAPAPAPAVSVAQKPLSAKEATRRQKLKEKKRAREKQRKAERAQEKEKEKENVKATEATPQVAQATPQIDVEVEYVAQAPDLDETVDQAVQEEYLRVFDRFLHGDKEDTTEEGSEAAPAEGEQPVQQAAEPEKKKLSKKERKKQKRLSVAVLKQLVKRPDVVEIHDVNSADPGFLVFLKSYRNTVPVPRHWCQKRKYLQGKRGIEKPPFKLPEFIEATGIQKIRQSNQEKEDAKRVKQKQRAAMQPKMGAIDIDYQVLHDAFFRYQTKPKLTVHGDLYYEGKEFEVSIKEKRPGEISDDLKKALGMPDGAPPPWLINQQRYGPPPSYPTLRIPGLTCPIPEGAQWGNHPGGWGKPALDDVGRPLYGDVFGAGGRDQGEPVDRRHWGEIEEEEEEEEVAGEEAPAADEANAGEEQMDIVDETADQGTQSVSEGMETPDSINLKKQLETPVDEAPKQLYQVLEEQTTHAGAAIMGSTHKYKIGEREAAAAAAVASASSAAPVAVTLQPSEMEGMEQLDETLIKKKFDELQAAKAELDVAPSGGGGDEDERVARKRPAAPAAPVPEKPKKKFRF